jgi:hypothetical protein
MALANWGRVINRRGVGLEPGEQVQSALLCSPRGSLTAKFVGQALGGVLDGVFDQSGSVGYRGPGGSAAAGGISGGVSSSVEGVLADRNESQDVTERQLLRLPPGDLILAVTPRRFLIYSADRGLLGTKIVPVGSVPHTAVSAATITEGLIAPKLTLNFADGGTVTFDVGRGQGSPNRFLRTLRQFQRR